MCGIVGAATERNSVPVLLEGLKRLEYRGYDSAGIAVIDENDKIQDVKVAGKIKDLASALNKNPIKGRTGIAHTRWATHGQPSKENAHPQISNGIIAVVHNGIIENNETLKEELIQDGYKFSSETDTEIVAHLIHKYFFESNDFLKSVRMATKKLAGAFALAIINKFDPKRVIAVRFGSPLIIGIGVAENFIASDHFALLPVTQKFIYMEEGEMADIRADSVDIFDKENKKSEYKVHTYNSSFCDLVDKGPYKHYMQKEIFEQPQAISDTLESRVNNTTVLDGIFGEEAENCFKKIKNVQIVACGTSYNAGLIGRFWIEEYAGIPCRVDVASEIRYRKTIVQPHTLFLTISQSGETADTIAALNQAKELKYQNTLTICNVPESSLVRGSDFSFLTRAGIEIGVASTKAFTTQLVSLLMLAIVLGKMNKLKKKDETLLVKQLHKLPTKIKQILNLDKKIQKLSEQFAEKKHVFFLGRGAQYPVAMEGALKLKEISYIHAESYPAGELKHGPLALIDKHTPVIVIAPNNKLIKKLISNIQEVKARGGKLIIFADNGVEIPQKNDYTIIRMPKTKEAVSPIIYIVALQLLAYHVANLKGTDIDQPRNLAKSVTVE